MKIKFFEDEKQHSEHESEPEEIAELFRLAEKVTDNDLEKMARLCRKMTEEDRE